MNATKTTTKTRKTAKRRTTPKARLMAALRETMTPHAIALIASKCQLHFAQGELGQRIEDEVCDFTQILMDMLGDDFNRLGDDMGL